MEFLEFNLGGYVHTDLRDKNNLENDIESHIKKWEKGSLPLHRRVIPIDGQPGIGKTWLLQYLHSLHENNSVYIDLKDSSKYGTVVGFTNSVKSTIRDTESSRNQGILRKFRKKTGLILLVDHVSGRKNTDVSDLERNVIRERLIDGNDFLIVAKQDTHWNFSGAIPHTTSLRLNGFVQKGINTVLEQNGWLYSERYKENFGEYSTHHPGLAYVVSNSPDFSGGLKEFLNYWSMSIGEGNISDYINPMRRLLLSPNLLDIEDVWDDWYQLKEFINKMELDMEPQVVKKYLQKLRWAQFSGEKEVTLKWAPPVKQALSALAQDV